MSNPRGRPRSRTLSPRGNEAEGKRLGRYEVSEIKASHADKHAKRTGSVDPVPSFMRPTLASLQKRQSFNHSGKFSYSKIKHNRAQTIDEATRRELEEITKLDPELFTRGALDMIPDGEDSELANEENASVNSADSGPVDLEQLRVETDRACASMNEERRLRRNSTGNNRHIEGGVSPLPVRSSDLTDPEDYFDMRPGSAAELRPVTTTPEELSRDSRTQTAPALLAGMEDVDVELTNEQLAPEQSPFGSAEPPGLMHSGSFDSTAAISTSPLPPRASSPFLTEAKRTAKSTKVAQQLDRTGPQNLQDNPVDDVGASDGSKGSADARCKPGAGISGSRSTGGVVHIQERSERRRPSDGHDKPNIKGSLILAAIFAGVAIIVGKIFVSKDADR